MPELSELNALTKINTAAARLASPIPCCSGRGVVICGGGIRYFPCAWVCINMLRRVGCKLPVELWYLGPSEMNDQMKSLVATLGVRCVDAYDMRRSRPARILNGWELKPYAIIHSAFAEVIALDADNVPLVDPSFLFDAPEYTRYGAIFWPDYGRLEESRPIWKLTGIPYRDEPEFESGQIVIDKGRCWKPLQLTMWMNEHSDFWYRHIHGDKETFHLCWRKLNQNYAMPSYGIHSLFATMCQHDFHGRRIFQHRNCAKWSIGLNRPIDGFQDEKVCLRFLGELRRHWTKVSGVPMYSAAAKTSLERHFAEQLMAEQWIYLRNDSEARPLSLLPDGGIGLGIAPLEMFWDIQIDGADVDLEIYSPESLTCRLRLDVDGVWRSIWTRSDFHCVELRSDRNQVRRRFRQKMRRVQSSRFADSAFPVGTLTRSGQCVMVTERSESDGIITE